MSEFRPIISSAPFQAPKLGSSSVLTANLISQEEKTQIQETKQSTDRSSLLTSPEVSEINFVDDIDVTAQDFQDYDDNSFSL